MLLGRLMRPADFQRALAVPPRSRSAHFAVHHVAARPLAARRRVSGPAPGELSTGDAPDCTQAVDESAVAVGGWWLGMVVPKRHARRSVTRNLIRRQIRQAVQARIGSGSGPIPASGGDVATRLPAGLWVVRLRAPFDPKTWPSAASDALRCAARDELERVLARAAA